MAYGNYAPFYRPGYFNSAQAPTIPQFQPMQENPGQYMPYYQNGLQGSSQPQSTFVWVLNENEALARYVAPGETEITWDKNSPTIYIKSVNSQGIPSMRILDFAERNADTAPKTPVEHACKCGGKYATLEAFNALQGEFEDFKRSVEQMREKKPRKTEKVEVSENE